MRLIENCPCDWSSCAKMSHSVYILPRDKDPRFRDEVKIRVGDLNNFANPLFYPAPTKLSAFCSPFFISSSSFLKFKVNGTSVFICSSGTCSHLLSSRIHNCFQVPKLLTESVFQFYGFFKCRCKSCVLRFIQVSIIVSRDKAARNKCARLRLSGISQRLQTVGSGLSFV